MSDIFPLLKNDLCELVGNLVFYAQSAITVISGRFVRIKKIKKEIKHKCFFFKNKNVDGGNLPSNCSILVRFGFSSFKPCWRVHQRNNSSHRQLISFNR